MLLTLTPPRYEAENAQTDGLSRQEIMKRLAARFMVVLALGVIIFAPRAGAQSSDGQQEGAREIEQCRTIDTSGSYKLVNNLTFTNLSGACLNITADFVTIDLVD
jgi:hypothetical protein